MRNQARIVTAISKLIKSNQRAPIPKGSCELDDGVHGTGPYIIYWKKNDQVFNAELTLSEFVTYIDVRTRLWPSMRIGKNGHPKGTL